MPLLRQTMRIATAPLRQFARCLPRWSAPTWRLVILTAIVLFLVEVPGRRTAPTTYAHGWPIAYLNRDYAESPNFSTPPQFDTLEAAYGSPEWAAKFAEEQAANRIPYEFEAAMSPWDFDGEIRWLIIAVDVALAIALLAAIGWAAEKWHRRKPRPARLRFFQYRLRTLLIAMPLFAAVFAIVAKWHHQHLVEQQLLDPGTGIFGPNSNFQETEIAWAPPHWLPESLQKCGIQSWFASLTHLRLRSDQGDVLKSIGGFKALRRLEVDFSSGNELSLISDARSLTELTLEPASYDIELPADGVRRIAKLPQLRTLAIFNGTLTSAALAELGASTSLEKMTLSCDIKGTFEVHGLPNLAELELAPVPGMPIGDGDLVRLRDLPALRSLAFDRETLDDESCRLLSRLPNLESLKLTECTIHGPLNVVGATQLASLHLNDCQMPAIVLRNLPQLQSLEIIRCRQVAEARFEHLPQLERIHENVYSRRFLLSVGDLPRLESLELERMTQELSEMRGPPPVVRLEARGVPNLADLGLRWLRLDPTTPAAIGGIPSLRNLRLATAWIGDDAIHQFKTLANLDQLDFAATEVSDAGLKDVLNLPKLRELHIGNSFIRLDQERLAALKKRLTMDVELPWEPPTHVAEVAAAVRAGNPFAFWDDHFSSLQMNNTELGVFDKLPGVQALDLWGAHVDDAGLAHLEGLTKLRALSLSETQTTDDGLKHLSGLSELEALGLADTAVSGPGLKHLAKLKKLRALDLAESDVTDEGLASLKYLPQLEMLRLSGLPITDAGLDHLKALQNLRWLDLSKTNITDDGLAKLQSVPKLRTLVLRKCNISGEGFAALSEHPSLAALDLRSTSLDRNAYGVIAWLPHLTQIDFDANPEAAGWSDAGIVAGGHVFNPTLAVLQRLPHLKTVRLAFAGDPSATNSSAANERTRVIDKLKRTLPGVEIVELPERELVADTFWPQAFRRPPGQRASQIGSDSPSVTPSSSPSQSGFGGGPF